MTVYDINVYLFIKSHDKEAMYLFKFLRNVFKVQVHSGMLGFENIIGINLLYVL